MAALSVQYSLGGISIVTESKLLAWRMALNLALVRLVEEREVQCSAVQFNGAEWSGVEWKWQERLGRQGQGSRDQRDKIGRVRRNSSRTETVEENR